NHRGDTAYFVGKRLVVRGKPDSLRGGHGLAVERGLSGVSLSRVWDRGIPAILPSNDAAGGNCRSQDRLTARIQDQLRAHRGLARNSLGLQLGTGARDVAGLVWSRSGSAIVSGSVPAA